MTWHCLVQIEPFDSIADARVMLRLTDADLREITGLGGMAWAPALAEAPKTSMTLFAGTFGDAVKPGGAQLPIVLPRAREHFAFVDRVFWPGAAVTLYIGRAGDAWPWAVHFRGKVASFQTNGDTLALTCEVDDSAFQVDVLNATYAGTSGAEGGADLKDKPKPLVLGHAKNVEPVLIDAVNSVYQFSGYGPIEAVDALFERAADFGAATGNYADYAALVAADVPAGRWATCLAQGMIRLGAPAFGVITGDVRGHAVAGSTPRLTGAVIQALASLAGVDSGALAGGTLDAMDTAAPYPINLVVTEQTRFIDLARRLALPCNRQAGISLTGQFFVAGIDFTGGSAGQPRVEVVDVAELSVSPPYARTMLGANRSWRVHTADEIAFDAPLVPRGLYSASETYRLGNIVSLPDQSEWLYIADTPGSGHAPPAWPTTANTWWSNTKPPATAADLTYADGTPIEDLKPAAPGATVNVGRGVYSASLTYQPGDMVVWAVADGGDGNGYIRIGTGTTTGVLPSDTSKWALSVERGQDGAPGVSTAEVYLYKRSASSLSAHGMTGTFTYTFGDATLTGGNLNGWSKTIPVGSDQLYVIAASAASNTATDTIAASEFSAPTALSAAGADGANGFNSATVMLFQRVASAPAVPAGTLTYTFSTGALSGMVAPWSTTVPTHNGAPLWMTTATAISQSGSDNIASGEWAAPQKMAEDGQDGADGADGAPGNDGAPGTPAISPTLSPDMAQVTAYANGGVASYAGASTTMYIMAGQADASANFTLSVVSNPQGLTTSISGRTVTVTNAGTASGQFGHAGTDKATITIRASGSGAYAGVALDKVFTLTKLKGGYEIVAALPTTNLFDGRVVYLSTDKELYKYASGWVKLIDTNAAIAAGKITGQLTDAQLQAISSTKITGQLTDAQIAAVAAAKLTGQITGTQITDSAISTTKLAASAVTANQLAANAVTADKIAAGQVTTAKLAAGAVTANEIAADAVTAGKIAAGEIQSAHIAAGQITTAKIAAAAITSTLLATSAVQANHIQAGAITTAKLAAGAVTANELAAGAVTANKIQAGTIVASKFVTDQGVDLAALVPGSINWRVLFADPTDLGGTTSDFDTGIVAISGTGAATPSSIISPAVSQTMWVGPSGGLTATANLDVYYRINGGSWVYIGRQFLSFGSTSPSGTTQTNNNVLVNGSTPVPKFSPNASGTIQFGYRHYSSHQGSGTFTFTSLERSLTFEIVNWK